ncbi:hotdog domain-containing protein [Streptomyces sp. NPDC056956]|uniref:hotdog domain-containing protein n=1 Tax=Streptomyces sp. NPDC056956 TaxID=3345980 RepID=UPI00363FD7DA
MADRHATLPTDTKHPAASRVTLAHIMSEHDTNLYGTIHGGVVMKLIDDAAAAAAGRHADGPPVTASVDGMAFLAPGTCRRSAHGARRARTRGKDIPIVLSGRNRDER